MKALRTGKTSKTLDLTHGKIYDVEKSIDTFDFNTYIVTSDIGEEFHYSVGLFLDNFKILHDENDLFREELLK